MKKTKEMSLKDKVAIIRNNRKIMRHNTGYYQAKEAFELKQKGLSLREIAKKLGVSAPTIMNITDQYEAGKWKNPPKFIKLDDEPELKAIQEEQ